MLAPATNLQTISSQEKGLKTQAGKEIRTPAMQAGLVSKRLSFRQIFTAMLLFVLVWLGLETEETRIKALKYAA